jgi:hypothetical protein
MTFVMVFLLCVRLQLALIPVICMIVDALYYFLAEEYAPSPPQLGREQNWCAHRHSPTTSHDAKGGPTDPSMAVVSLCACGRCMPASPQPAAPTVAEMMA